MSTFNEELESFVSGLKILQNVYPQYLEAGDLRLRDLVNIMKQYMPVEELTINLPTTPYTFLWKQTSNTADRVPIFNLLYITEEDSEEKSIFDASMFTRIEISLLVPSLMERILSLLTEQANKCEDDFRRIK